jgi:CRP-like cAMP-binding protein
MPSSLTTDADSLGRGGNDLLSILPHTTLARMAPHSLRVTLAQGQVISDANEPMQAALFIESGIASVFKPQGARQTEICLVGPESFCGIPLILEDDSWPYRTVVQSDQVSGVQIEASVFRQLVATDADLRRVLMRALQVRLVQISEALVSNATQRLNQRLARWLLMYRDRLGSDRLPITHEFLAMMLGAQRTGVTSALHEVEAAGLITTKRGVVTIRCLSGLLALAGESYGEPERRHAKLLASGL